MRFSFTATGVPADSAVRNARLVALCGAFLSLAAVTSAYEGFGYQTVGGRGGSTCHVTNLAGSGSGSLYDCVINRVGARTVVFDVSGTITPDDTLWVRDPYLTVDGTTAPSPGITIVTPSGGAVPSFAVESTHDVILTGLRMVGFATQDNVGDLVRIDGTDGEVYNIVLDHLSLNAAD
ncbi:MAG TPA: hypothetical protein VEQ10_06945, partial [Vicinamibacteria bacterium]|nr:hypothetical protein [Vicinamibacteria bacterium]